MLAFITGTCLMLHLLPDNRKHYNLRLTSIVLIPVLLFSLIGAKMMFALLDGGDLWKAIFFWQAGYYHHGGLIGGILGYVLYLRFTGNNILDGLDWIAPFGALGESITRIGCFLGGCCWGKESQTLLAVVYPAESHAWVHHIITGRLFPSASCSLPVHPVPLYTSVVMLFLYVFLRRLQQRRKFPGDVALHYLFWHSLWRIILECFRDDIPRLENGWTSTQMLAASIVMISAVFLCFQYTKAFRNIFLNYGGRQPQEDPG